MERERWIERFWWKNEKNKEEEKEGKCLFVFGVFFLYLFSCSFPFCFRLFEEFNGCSFVLVLDLIKNPDLAFGFSFFLFQWFVHSFFSHHFLPQKNQILFTSRGQKIRSLILLLFPLLFKYLKFSISFNNWSVIDNTV